MNSYNRKQTTGGFSPAVLLLLGAVLTAAIILGIKFLVGEDSAGSPPQSSGQGEIFKINKATGGAAGYNPAARSESTSGDSLDIFKKTNTGYAADESSSTAETPLAVPEPVKKPAAEAAAKTKQRAKEPQKNRQRTAIPRMQKPKAFGTAAPDKRETPKGGAAAPDLSDILKQTR